MSQHPPVCVKWKALKHCLVSTTYPLFFPIPLKLGLFFSSSSSSLCTKILLKNGVLVTVTVARHSGDIERLNIDKSLVTRLPSNIDAGNSRLLSRAFYTTLHNFPSISHNVRTLNYTLQVALPFPLSLSSVSHLHL